MKRPTAPHRKEHPLFHTLVMVGGSMALQCGGNVSGDDDSTGAAGEGGDRDGGTPPTSTGGTPGFGARGGLGAGGANATGGTTASGGIIFQLPTGGTASTGGVRSTGGVPPFFGGYGGGTGDPPIVPIECTPAQWDCGDLAPVCNYDLDGFVLPQGCACDPSRPAVPADCPAGTSIVCSLGVASAGGDPLSPPIPFSCECTPAPTCIEACDGYFTNYDIRCVQEASNGMASAYYCGCAVVVLR